MKHVDIDPKDYAALGLPDPASLPIGSPEVERLAPRKYRASDGRIVVRVLHGGTWIWREQEAVSARR